MIEYNKKYNIKEAKENVAFNIKQEDIEVARKLLNDTFAEELVKYGIIDE